MANAHGITHYDQMPIPPVEAQTRYFDASPISIGVQYRLLDDAIVAASRIETAMGNASGPSEFDDRGVALHIFGSVDGERLEYLRFDCFDEDPHYHYICWRDRSNRMIHIDPIAEGDPLDWALERIRTRLPQMLEFAGAPQIAAEVDLERIEKILPRVREVAKRIRLHHDPESIRRSALGEEAR